MGKKTILTGLRPTGNLHLGHYFGALTNWVKLQDTYNSYFEIADVQALTDNFNNPAKVRKNVRETTIDLLSVGIDPNKATIFVQSMIPEIAELTVYFSNLVTIARLYRNPTVKNEAKQMGCYEVTLNVWAGNTSAEKFYEKMGMRTKERQMEYIL